MILKKNFVKYDVEYQYIGHFKIYQNFKDLI
jgi:hypothetical protein